MVSFIFLLFSTFTSAKEQTLETGNLNNKLTHYLISNNSVAVKNILQTCGECSQFIDPLLLEWANGILARQEKTTPNQYGITEKSSLYILTGTVPDYNWPQYCT